MWIALITPVLISMGAFSLLLAAAIVFAETGLLAGFFLPGDSLLFTIGVLTASGVLPLSIVIVLATLVAAAVLGDTAGYLIGRRLGPRLFSRPRSRLFDPTHLVRADCFVGRHGPGALVIARFVPWARTFVPVVVGVGAMAPRTFVRLNFLGGTLWVCGVVLAGYALGQVSLVADHVRMATFLLGMATLMPVLAVRLVARLRRATPVADDLAAGEDPLLVAA